MGRHREGQVDLRGGNREALCGVSAVESHGKPNSKSSRLRLICYNYHIFYILLRLFRRLTTPRSAMPFLESEVRSQESGVRSQESGVQESGVRSQEPGARSQEPGARSQESGARQSRSQQSEIKNGQFAYATVGRENTVKVYTTADKPRIWF